MAQHYSILQPLITTDMISFDDKIKVLESFGFAHTKVGMSTDKYAFLYHQIDELTDDEFNECVEIYEYDRKMTQTICIVHK